MAIYLGENEVGFNTTYGGGTIEALSVTPTESQQVFNATGVYGYKPVTVNGISSTYVGTGVSQRSSANTTFANATGTFTAPAGYYSAAATNTITTQAAQTIYPSTADQTIASRRWLTGAQTIKSVTTSNLTAENIAEGITVKVGDATNASRIAQITGTHSGAPKYTATIGSLSINGNEIYYNSSRIYQNTSFNYNAGDTLVLELYGTMGGCNIYEDGVRIAGTDMGSPYSYILPSHDITLYAQGGGAGTCYINAVVPSGYIKPSGVYDITSNGIYDVTNYASASVSVTPSEQYYSVYKHLTFKSAFTSTTDSNIYQSFFNNISSITRYMFAQILMSGSFSFSNCTYIDSHAFEHTEYNTCGVCNFDFPEVLSINSYAFNFQSFLKTISAPKCSYIGSAAFGSCYSLTSANFPNCSYIGYWAFQSCSNLTTVSFPSCSTIGVSAFYNCYNLTSANFPKCTILYSYAFYSCSNLTTVSFPILSYIYSGVFGRCYKLETVNIPNCQNISEYAFYNCSGLTNVDFPSCSWISYSAFTNCIGLTSVNFPNCSYVGSSAFTSCYSLSTADFSTCSIVYGSAFYGCYNLTTAKFPNCTSFGANTFRNCYNLISLYLNNVSSVPTFGTNMFYSTPMSNYSTSAGRYGSIFVPSSLYADFTTAANWSAYSAHMVSV